MIRSILTKFVLIGTAIFIMAQDQADSLNASLESGDQKLEYVHSLLDSAKGYLHHHHDSVEYFVDKVIKLSIEGDYPEKRAQATNYIALSHYYSFRYAQAMEKANKAYDIWDDLNNDIGKGDVLNLKGMIYWREGKYSDALFNYRSSLKFYTKAGDGPGQTKVLNNMGNLMNELGNRGEAIKYFFDAEKVSIVNSPKNLAIIYNNIGNAYEGLKKCDSAMLYFKKSLHLCEQHDHKQGRALILNNMANVYVHKGDFEKALALYLKAEKSVREIGNKQLLSKVLINIGTIHSANGNRAEAKQRTLEAYELAKSVDYILAVKDASKLLMNIENDYQDYEEAFKYSQTYLAAHDSLFLSQKMLELGRLEAGYTFDKEQVILNEKIKSQNTIRTGLLVVLILSVLLMTFLFRTFQIKRTSNRILEQKNADLAIQKRHIEYLNRNLESLVDERTTELQRRNSQLEKYAFINAHEVRAPLARILGLMHLREMDIAEQEEEKIFSRMYENALELDQVVKNMNVTLQE